MEMEPKPNSTEEFREELEVWERVPKDLREPLLQALKIGCIAFDFIRNPDDSLDVEEGYESFFEATKIVLYNNGINIEPWLRDRNHPICTRDPFFMFLHYWPRTRLSGFRDLLDVFAQTVHSQKAN